MSRSVSVLVEKGGMIQNDQELEATLQRIRWFQDQLTHLRKVETNPVNYRLSSSGFLAEIDRMQLEVREYLALLPAELEANTRSGTKTKRVAS
jgi:hypothetical protein